MRPNHQKTLPGYASPVISSSSPSSSVDVWNVQQRLWYLSCMPVNPSFDAFGGFGSGQQMREQRSSCSKDATDVLENGHSLWETRYMRRYVLVTARVSMRSIHQRASCAQTCLT